MDSATGQYYLRARFYNPVIGRFTQQDTYHGDGLNLYAYCQNNPVMYCDPTGHDSGSAADKAWQNYIQKGADAMNNSADKGANAMNNYIDKGTDAMNNYVDKGTNAMNNAVNNDSSGKKSSTSGNKNDNPLNQKKNEQKKKAEEDSGSKTGNDVDKKDNSGGGYRTLSKGKFKHVFNRHTYNNVKKQLEHMIKTVSRNELETDISARSFFNKNWSEQEIMSGVENAYNQLLQAGMNHGNYVVKIKGEDVTIVIDNGVFKTAWGHHHYSLEDFGL